MGSDSSMSNDLASVMLALPPNPQTVAPMSGIIGTVLTIKGSGLLSTTGVQVGGMQSLAVIVVDDTTVTAVVPTLSLGAKPVMVQSPNAPSGVLAPQQFTVSLS